MATASGRSRRPALPTDDSFAVVALPSPRRRGDAYVLVTGDIDILNAPELDRLLHDHLDTVPGGGSLLVDLRGVGHFSAAGVAALCRAAATARRRHVALHLGPVSRQVGRVLDICEVNLGAEQQRRPGGACHAREMGIRELAATIDSAHRARRLLDAATQPPLDLSTAYAVQRELTALRTALGASPIGVKLGYTSRAMREQMGVDEPNHGPLLDTMLITDGHVPDVLVHPRIEPEIAVVLGPDLRPVAAHAALEVVDSVWRDYRFTLELNTADGSSAAGMALGPPLPLDALDTVPVVLLRNGDPVGRGTGAAAMGHPLHALEWLRRTVSAEPGALRPGDVVLTGGLTAAVPVEPGDVVEAVFGDGASVRLHRA